MPDSYDKTQEQIDLARAQVAHALHPDCRPEIGDLELARRLLEARGWDVQLVGAYAIAPPKKRTFMATLRPRWRDDGVEVIMSEEDWKALGRDWKIEDIETSTISPLTESHLKKSGTGAIEMCEYGWVLDELLAYDAFVKLDKNSPAALAKPSLKRRV